MGNNRKLVKHSHEPGDLHELTFSCFQQMPLLTNGLWKKLLCESINRAMLRHQFGLVAFVIMPEHVHLLVDPLQSAPKIDKLLYAIKRPFSYRIKSLLLETSSPLLKKLTIQERPGKQTFRFWQEGPGYDRNLNSEKAALAAIDYIHNNPARRGLVEQAKLWKWSSYPWYESDGQYIDPDLPAIHGLRPGFFT